MAKNKFDQNDTQRTIRAFEIKSTKDLEDILGTVLKSNQKTILIVIYNNQNQRRYIGVKLD